MVENNIELIEELFRNKVDDYENNELIKEVSLIEGSSVTIAKDDKKINQDKIEELTKKLNVYYNIIQKLKEKCFEGETDAYKGMSLVNKFEEDMRNLNTTIENIKMKDKTTEIKTEKNKDFTEISSNNLSFLNNKRKITNDTKENTNKSNRIRIDDDINATFHKTMNISTLYISNQLKDIYGNEKEIIAGINNKNIGNNTKKENFLCRSIIKNIELYKPRNSKKGYGEKIVQHIENKLSGNIPGKEEKIKNLKFFVKGETSIAYKMYMNDENFYLDKNKKKINIIGFKTFKDDF